MSRSYERLSIEVFGRKLITSGDLDPVYIALAKMELPHDHLCRWLIAYWCLYHCGVASYLSEFEGDEFWRRLDRAALNVTSTPLGGRWPRGSERRHWRGHQALVSCAELRDRYGARPQDMVGYIAGGECTGPRPFHEVSRRVQEHRGFGPWIAFKVGDMLDRLGLEPVNFVNADVFMFKDPAMAAKMLFAQRSGLDPTGVKTGAVKVKEEVIPEVVRYLESEFADLTAPPIHERPVGLQEVETVLCKWKSHMNGHYPLYNDILEIREGVMPWTDLCDTARQFYASMPLPELKELTP